MIINSTIWKKDLSNEIDEIEEYFNQVDFVEIKEPEDENDEIYNKSFIKLQKFAIYSSIVIRKLIEANKISDELMSQNFSIFKYNKVSSQKVTVLNGYELEELYDMENPIKMNTNLKRLTDDIIHSFHFMPKYNWRKNDEKLDDSEVENWINKGLIGFHLSSDKSKEKNVQLIRFEQFILIIKEVINDFIVSGTYKNGKIVTKSKYNASS